MDAKRFITLLERSQNTLLRSAAKDIEDWSKLKHNKECLEYFLRHTIAVVTFGGSEVLVSSNAAYLGYLNGLRNPESKSKVVRVSPKFESILRSRNPGIVRTWDLIKNRKVEIQMDEMWSIMTWIGVNRENIQPMASATREILDKSKVVRK